MYKNHQSPNADVSASAGATTTVTQDKKVISSSSAAEVNLTMVKELLEKNLKWSQIIYEQNRRLNSKLFWGAFASWFKILLFLGVFGWSVLILSPFLKNALKAYEYLLGRPASGVSSTSSLQSILPLLPLDSAQKEQLKAWLK